MAILTLNLSSRDDFRGSRTFITLRELMENIRPSTSGGGNGSYVNGWTHNPMEKEKGNRGNETFHYDLEGKRFIDDSPLRERVEGEVESRTAITNRLRIKNALDSLGDTRDADIIPSEEEESANEITTIGESNERASVEDIKIFNGTTLFFRDKYMSEPELEPALFLEEDLAEIYRYEGLWATQLRALYNNKAGYASIHRDLEGAVGGSPAEDEVYVRIFSKTLASTRPETSGYIDVSNYVISCKTNISLERGTFEVVLSSVGYEEILSELEGDLPIIERPKLNKLTSTVLNRNSERDRVLEAFDTLFQRNDLVFIRFEKLALEEFAESSQEVFATEGGLGPLGEIGRESFREAFARRRYAFDIIGLVSSVSTTRSPSDNRYKITIAGFDFRKILSEDMATASQLAWQRLGTTVGDAVSVAGSTGGETSSERIKALEDELVALRKKRSELEDGEELSNEDKTRIEELLPEIELLNNAVTVRARQEARRIRESSFIEARNIASVLIVAAFSTNLLSLPSLATVLRFYLSLFSSVPSLPDTREEGGSDPDIDAVYNYGNPFSFYEEGEASREPYLTIDGSFQSPIINSQEWLEGLRKRGIWRIVRLAIDEPTAKRKVIHTNFSLQQTSAMSILRKFVNPKIVEFYCDTYGKDIVLIFRKPPFDRTAYISALGPLLQEETGASTGERINGMTVSIPKEEVVTDSLMWESEVYSWYRVEPLAHQAVLAKAKLSSFLVNIEVKFDEYVALCGNKPLIIKYPYIPSIEQEKITSNTALAKGFTIRQLAADMVYLIESHQYLPFSRRGIIQIHGDRRIKVGTFIFYESTGEIFYVVSVDNSYRKSPSLSRTTTLGVVRGLVQKHIEGYFNIIDVRGVKRELRNSFSDEFRSFDSINSLFEGVTVNRDLFRFFTERKQFDPSSSPLPSVDPEPDPVGFDSLGDFSSFV